MDQDLTIIDLCTLSYRSSYTLDVGTTKYAIPILLTFKVLFSRFNILEIYIPSTVVLANSFNFSMYSSVLILWSFVYIMK